MAAESSLTEWLFDAIIAPGQATLFALLAFFMIAAAYRLLRGRNGGGWMLAALLMLTAQALQPACGCRPASLAFAGWTLDVPVMATLRGAPNGRQPRPDAHRHSLYVHDEIIMSNTIAA